MDPNATWKDMLEALANSERLKAAFERGEVADESMWIASADEAFDHARNLRDWIANGGFPPDACPAADRAFHVCCFVMAGATPDEVADCLANGPYGKGVTHGA